MQEDIRGFDVSMHYSGGMDFGEHLADRTQDLDTSNRMKHPVFFELVGERSPLE